MSHVLNRMYKNNITCLSFVTGNTIMRLSYCNASDHLKSGEGCGGCCLGMSGHLNSQRANSCKKSKVKQHTRFVFSKFDTIMK